MSQHETTAATLGGSDNSGIRMTLSFSDPDAARELLLFLGRSMSDASVSIDAVSSTDSDPHVVPVDSVTAAQQATARYAVACGYYDDPRRAHLADIAAEFDRSKSAISQRLSAVERHLVRSFVEASDDPNDRIEC